MSSEILVSELSLKLAPVKPVPFARVLLQWAVITLLSLAALVTILGVRPDLSARMAEPLFMAELIIAAILVLATGLAACSLAYPDRSTSRMFKSLMTAIMIGYGLMLANAVLCMALCVASGQHDAHSAECFVCIVGFAAIPAVWTFWKLRQLATIRPELLGFVTLLMAATTGCLGVRLVEEEVIADGAMLWHYLPVFLLSMMGLWLGKKIFRW